MNITIGKQIIGFEAEAMDLMHSFPWPGNLDQLHHVIKELVVITQTPYITYTDTKAILDAEPAISGNAPQTTLNLSTTLDEMNYQIIQWVLAEEHGNKRENRQTSWHKQKHSLENVEKIKKRNHKRKRMKEYAPRLIDREPIPSSSSTCDSFLFHIHIIYSIASVSITNFTLPSIALSLPLNVLYLQFF